MWQSYILTDNINEVTDILAREGGNARIVAGATDLILEIERGVRRGIETLIDVTRIPRLNEIRLDKNGVVHLGPLVTHNDCVASDIIRRSALPLAQACWEVGSPQIRNRGTIAGNLITASPANDTITPLMALGARVELRSAKGVRTVPLSEFYTGVRRTVMQPDEMLVDIQFAAMNAHQKGIYLKNALRQAQAISVVNLAMVLEFSGEKISAASITLGSVAPTIVHAQKAEAFLINKGLTEVTIEECARLVGEDAKPISDVRGSSNYRQYLVGVIAKRGLSRIARGDLEGKYPASPILLKTESSEKTAPINYRIDNDTPIVTTINEKKYIFKGGQNKTLLHLLREEGKLIGTKEGCSEGECGACTVFLDGMAVMSCMVPAPRAHGATITTIEGIAPGSGLHPVQEAFISEGAVQCGYCTPGFIMASVKLLEEKPHPGQEDIRQALTGNLCRCTGYYSIIRAIEKAAMGGYHEQIST